VTVRTERNGNWFWLCPIPGFMTLSFIEFEGSGPSIAMPKSAGSVNAQAIEPGEIYRDSWSLTLQDDYWIMNSKFGCKKVLERRQKAF